MGPIYHSLCNIILPGYPDIAIESIRVKLLGTLHYPGS